MEEKLDVLRENLEPLMNDMNIILDDIEYIYENKNWFLRITLDKVNGIDLDTIVKATEVINPVVDKLDLFEESYIMDVLSKEGCVDNG